MLLTAAGLAQLRQGGLTSTDQILVAEKAGAWSEALALYEQALSQEASATAAAAAAAAAAATEGGRQGGEGAADEGHGSYGRLGAAAADVLINAACAVVSGLPPSSAAAQQHRLSTWQGLEQLQPAANLAGLAAGAGSVGAAGQGAGRLLGTSQACISSLQVGHLRCLLQMGHQQTLLRQVDGLMARCLGQAAAVAVTPAAVAGQAAAAAAAVSQGAGEGALQAVQWSLGQLAALGVAAAWRLGAWDQLRGYLSVLEAAGNSPDGVLRPLSAADRWEVSASLTGGPVMSVCSTQLFAVAVVKIQSEVPQQVSLCMFSAPAALCALVRRPFLAAVLKCVHHCLRPDSRTCHLVCIAVGFAAVLHGCNPGSCTAWLTQGGHEWAAQCTRRRAVTAASHRR